ncbi:hypothetical protein DPMN_109520 [Dreissena polymorpha]|uniref:Uncharacterized protein n=1 Tax=Dreissena polymorpha TaxID=45954 RepID=A0A9D4KAF1_DREPO|nr:hypothetical protein DPMN_109520 [Dreissena polymorpha]
MIGQKLEKCPAHWRPYINKINVLTTFHDDWAKIVTSTVFKRKTAPSTGGHVFQQTGTTFELNQDIIKTNILTSFGLGRDYIGGKLLSKFHEDWTTSVASRVFTSKSHLSNQADRQMDGQTDRQQNNIPPLHRRLLTRLQGCLG